MYKSVVGDQVTAVGFTVEYPKVIFGLVVLVVGVGAEVQKPALLELE